MKLAHANTRGVLALVCRTECDELREWRLCCKAQERDKKDHRVDEGEKKTVTAKVDAVGFAPDFGSLFKKGNVGAT